MVLLYIKATLLLYQAFNHALTHWY